MGAKAVATTKCGKGSGEDCDAGNANRQDIVLFDKVEGEGCKPGVQYWTAKSNIEVAY